MEEIILSESQRDALKEIGNVCSGNAATALSQLSGKKISIVVPRILFVPIEKVPDIVGGADKLVAGLVIRVLGDIPSHILFVFSQKDILILSSFLTHKPITLGGVITEIDRSALKEVGVILANAYLGSLSAFIGVGLIPKVPELIIDMAGAMVDYILIELSEVSRFALMIESEFKETTTSLSGNFFLIPNSTGFELLLKAIAKF